ncbi:hypothetical protein V494_03943 [Pseudogymnoascus sp. VKM F-4513 (FW-928)]|nr:hypothetical protein V494_03943 [Pseudogymnoascus sp. VKM F-4513 (FW-928)]
MATLPTTTRQETPATVALRNFKTQWFLVPQGTGIIAVILHQLKYQFTGLNIISYIFWLLTIISLTLLLAIFALKIVIFPKVVANSLRTEIGETACLSSISITFTSIIEMMDLSLVGAWGKGWGIATLVLWWINAAMAIVSCIGITYVFMKYEAPGVRGLTPVANLPVIAALTAAAGGGVLCRYGELDEGFQVPVIIVSYLLIGMALPIAFAVATIFMARLFDQSSPAGTTLYQDMILCGPWGQGSFALQILGEVVTRGSFAKYQQGVFLTLGAAGPVGFASMFGGLLAWGHGTFWWVFAIISVLHSGFNKRGEWRGLHFGLGAWSLVFPWGVYTNACVQLGKLLDSPAFSVWSAILAITLVIIWIVNMVLTTKGLITGKLVGLEHGWGGEAYKRHQIEKGQSNGTVDQRPVTGLHNRVPKEPPASVE